MEIDLACLDPTIKYQLQPTVLNHKYYHNFTSYFHFSLNEYYHLGSQI